jgi:asparagine synthase (glutamine-hydrolysing)
MHPTANALGRPPVNPFMDAYGVSFEERRRCLVVCGVAGIYPTKCRIDKTRNLVEEIIESQYRRGPDHQAIDAIAGERATLVVGANRLSIIDLSSEANQAMWDNERRYCLVFNGEIYNYVELRKELIALWHSFSTRSDSEVAEATTLIWLGNYIP